MILRLGRGRFLINSRSRCTNSAFIISQEHQLGHKRHFSSENDRQKTNAKFVISDLKLAKKNMENSEIRQYLLFLLRIPILQLSNQHKMMKTKSSISREIVHLSQIRMHIRDRRPRIYLPSKIQPTIISTY